MVPPTILCIDDSPLVHSLVTRSLEPYDVRLIHAEDGMMGTHFAFNEMPELVLLDVKMPGLNGYEVLEKLRKDSRTRDVAVLVITSETVRENVLRLLKFGIQDYIVKPFDEKILVDRISRHVSLHRRGISPAKTDSGKISVSTGPKSSSQKLTPASIMPRQRPTARTTKLRVQKFNISDGQPIEGILETNVADKLDDYVLLLGSMNAYLNGIFLQLFECGKVRVEFRDRCERLTLAEGDQSIGRKEGIRLLEEHMSKKGMSAAPDLDLGATQKIDLKREKASKK